MTKLLGGLSVLVLTFLFSLLMAALLAIVTQVAWEGSVVEIFHFAPLSFGQAFWLNVLAGMLFKQTSSVKKD